MEALPEETTDLVKNSSLYSEFMAEREEILRHKWIESEKAGVDIGFERALMDWIVRYRSAWREQRQAFRQTRPIRTWLGRKSVSAAETLQIDQTL